MIVDTHIHLNDKQYYNDIDTIITNAKKAGVGQFIIPGADPDELKRAFELSEQYEEVFYSVGVHPYDIIKYDEKFLVKYIDNKKCVAIGECGLDYFRLPKNKQEKEKNIAKQKEIFRLQIRLAKKYKKPLIVHVRDASLDTKMILLEEKAGEVGGVLHCFNADHQLLSLSEENFYFGIGGVVTFKNAKKLVDILDKIPLEKLLIETDGPYLTPHPFRGERNEPKHTVLVIKKISSILNLGFADIVSTTTKNANRLFRLV